MSKDDNNFSDIPHFFLLFVQFSGISGVLYYTPQILQQAGVSVLLSNLGLGSESASFLISAFTNFLMLPSAAVAMRFMDVAGRRYRRFLFPPVLHFSDANLLVSMPIFLELELTFLILALILFSLVVGK